MRIRTSGKFAFRRDEIEAVADLFGCNRTDALIRAARHTKLDARNKRQALEYCRENLPAEDTAALAALLSTPYLELQHEVTTNVSPSDG